MTTTSAVALGRPRPNLLACLRHALAGILALCAAQAGGAGEGAGGPTEGIEARFMVPQAQADYALGEPVVLEFVVRNASGNDFHFGIVEHTLWGFRFNPMGAARDRLERREEDRARTDGGPTPYSVGPGRSLRKRILLGRYLTFKAPGTYRVLCEIDAPITRPRRRGEPSNRRRDYLSVSQEVEIVIGPFDRQKVVAAADRLVARLNGPDRRVGRQAVRELAHVHPEVAKPRLETALGHADALVRAAAIDGLARVAGKEAIPVLARALGTERGVPRERIASALGRIGAGDRQALAALYSLLADEDEGTRLTAIMGVGRIGDGASIARLEPLLKHPDPRTRRVASGWIEHLRRRYPQ